MEKYGTFSLKEKFVAKNYLFNNKIQLTHTFKSVLFKSNKYFL